METQQQQPPANQTSMTPLFRLSQSRLQQNQYKLADTDSSSNSDLNVKRWLDKIIDTAQKEFMFMQAVEERKFPPNTKDIVVPYRKNYLSTMTDQTSEGTAVTFTEMNNLNGVTVTPTPHAYGIGISYHALRTNAVNLVMEARRELANYYTDILDQAVATALRDATEATSQLKGAQVLYGGDATSTATLEVGDVLTPQLITKARRYLQSTKCFYSSSAVSAAAKAPWRPGKEEPFLLYIGAEQENQLLDSDKFTNAAEYGGQEPLLTGEIGKFVNIKVINAANTPAYTNWGGASVHGHVCLLVKKNVCGAIGFNQKPMLRVFDYPRELEKDLVLEMAYKVEPIHTDSIVKIKVTDEDL